MSCRIKPSQKKEYVRNSVKEIWRNLDGVPKLNTGGDSGHSEVISNGVWSGNTTLYKPNVV